MNIRNDLQDAGLILPLLRDGFCQTDKQGYCFPKIGIYVALISMIIRNRYVTCLGGLLRKILYFALGMILVLVIYGSQSSNEIFSGYFEPYKIKNSTDIMTFSIDNSTYRQGQTINFAGKVNNFNEGTKVQIIIIDPLKNTIAQFGSLVNRYGIFNGYYDIPGTVPNGKYLINSYYEGDQNKKIVSLSVNISFITKGLVYISIPYGASTEGNKINFDPRSVTVNQGTQITWINNDNTLHSVVSGKIKPNGTISQDDRFASAFITPADTYVISPAPGNYTYFCKIHPWLAGQISVKAIKPPAKPPASSGTGKPKPTPFPVSDAVLTTIWKERSDLQKLYPEAGKGNLTGMKKWASTTGWNQDKRLAPLIPAGKVPAYSQPSPMPSYSLSNNVLLSVWEGRTDLQGIYPEVKQGNFGNLKKWATKFGWDEDERLAALIPAGKVPSYLNDVLLSIWKERSDLQISYPEAAQGNLTNLNRWATTKGWDQDTRLSVLTPPSTVPSYLNDVLLSIWKERSDLQKSYPEAAQGNLTNLNRWATTKGWDQDKRLAVLIPTGKVPSYLNDILLSIWQDRRDLQKAYPEVAYGNLDNLKKWATTFGWNEDYRLAVLIPPGKIPSYLNHVLLLIWNERSDLQKAYPEAAKNDLTNLKNWATTTGWNQDIRLAVLIPPGKIPSYPQS